MQIAIEQAKAANTQNDRTSHAEIYILRAAGRVLRIPRDRCGRELARLRDLPELYAVTRREDQHAGAG